MKYLKYFESFTNAKMIIAKEIYKFLKFLTKEDNTITIDNDVILPSHIKGNKINRIKVYNFNKDYRDISVEIVTIKKNINPVFCDIMALSYDKIFALFDYLKKRYSNEYQDFLISLDADKYNL
jgi:hypothetical protein